MPLLIPCPGPNPVLILTAWTGAAEHRGKEGVSWKSGWSSLEVTWLLNMEMEGVTWMLLSGV